VRITAGRGFAALIVAWHTTDSLVVDRDGILWHAVRTEEGGPVRHRCLGPIEDGPDLPEALETEYAECLDLWSDRFDDRAEQLWNYLNRG
jgi:hypothetical protein